MTLYNSNDHLFVLFLIYGLYLRVCATFLISGLWSLCFRFWRNKDRAAVHKLLSTDMLHGCMLCASV